MRVKAGKIKSPCFISLSNQGFAAASRTERKTLRSS
jgi:hypothetical protein